MKVQNANSTLAQVKGSHLIVESLGDEVVVFDRRTNKAHILDPRAAAIWKAAKDGCTEEDVVRLMEGASSAEQRSVAHLAISDLKEAGLLTSDVLVPKRRQLLKTLGRVAALPMVISLLAPTPAAAASILDGDICVFGVDTCIGLNGFMCENVGPSADRCCMYDVARVDTKTFGENCGGNLECCGLMCAGTCTTFF